MNREGKRVAYVGQPSSTVPLNVGDTGRVLSDSGDSLHVQWTARLVTMVAEEDVVLVSGHAVRASAHPLDDSLSVPGLSTVAVRETYEAEGEVGLLNALNEAGTLGGLAQIAEDALAYVASRVREDTEMAAVLADLEPEERDGLVSLASSVLLRDAFGGGE